MLRTIWTYLVLVVSTVLLGIPATVVSLFHPGSHIVMRLGKYWSRWILRASGIPVSYVNREHMPLHRPCVYISNHQGVFDIWAMVASLPMPTLFVAKKSLFSVPVMGWALRASQFIPIDRRNRASAIQSLQLAAARIREGRPLLLFAEGTRSRDGRLGPFKRGAFYVALQAGVPVVPVAISGSWKILPPGSLLIHPGRIRVTFAPPLEVADYQPNDVHGLMAAVRQAIVERLEPEEAGPAGVP